MKPVNPELKSGALELIKKYGPAHVASACELACFDMAVIDPPQRQRWTKCATNFRWALRQLIMRQVKWPGPEIEYYDIEGVSRFEELAPK